jgi:pimeloyl-ACP methyl ester carboxylesterase
VKLKKILQIFKKRAFPLFRKQIKNINIDGKKIKYIYADKGTPYTIVFENGLGTGMAFWDKTFLDLSKEHSVFAYSCPFKDEMKITKEGWGDDAQSVTENIKVVLDKCKIITPYILVGHSLGGLYIQLFTKEYPDIVKAMVLVDGTYPDEFSDMEAMQIPLKLQKAWKNLSKNATNIGQTLLTSPITKEIPITILSALLKEDIHEHPEWGKMISCMHKKQEEYLTLYPWAKQNWVDSGHNIHFEKPEVVIDAVKEVMNA